MTAALMDAGEDMGVAWDIWKPIVVHRWIGECDESVQDAAE